MDCLIAGCGYLGGRVAARWLSQGHRVFATTRSPEGAAALKQQGLQAMVCDVLDPASLKQLPAVQTVCHAVGWDKQAGRTMRDVYVTGLANLLDRLPAPERFIFVSSSGVYGQAAGEEVDENSATEPLDDSGKVVLEAERLLHYRLPAAIILRLAGIYGPGRLFRRDALLAGQPLVGDPDRWLNLIQVDDAAAAVQAAQARGQKGTVYNVADGCPVRRRDFFQELARLLGAPPPRFQLPGPGTPVPSHERTNRRIVARRLREELGVHLEFPSYREGLANALQGLA